MEGTTSQWFTSRETYEREIAHPETKEKATVTLRPLNAGDRAELNEIRILSDDDGEGGHGEIRPGRQQILCVQRALVAWSLEQPISDATIAQLDPRVFDQIMGHVSFGTPKPQEAANVTPLPGAERRDAAASS